MEENSEKRNSLTAKESSISSEQDVNLISSSAKIVGSTINAGNDLNITTDVGDIEIVAVQQTSNSQEHHKKISVSLADMFNPIALIKESIDSLKSDGKAKVTLAKASYDEVDTTNNDITHKASAISAGNDININSGADIKLEGSHIAGATKDKTGTVTLIAKDGDIIILESEDSLASSKKEFHGEAKVSFVVEHKAVEIAKLVLALKKPNRA